MKEAPKKIPKELMDGYTMNGKAEILYKYQNDIGGDTGTNIKELYSMDKFNEYLKRIPKKDVNESWGSYGPTDGWLYKILQAFPIKNQHVLIIGSTNPWYETIAIHYGAYKCTVLEYRKQESFHPQIEYITPDEIGDTKFDCCISISSVEHDGLGRYGDPLNPDADLEHMQNLKKLIVPYGLLYLAVPIGDEKVVFNLHRVYGPKRFYKLIKGWTEIADVGFEVNDGFNNKVNGVNGTPYQPIFLLQNQEENTFTGKLRF